MTPAPKRRSLRDRNADAIAGPPTEEAQANEHATPEPPAPEASAQERSDAGERGEQPPAATSPKATPSRAASSTKRAKPAPKQTPGRPGPATARLGIYFTPSEFDAAKAAYLADWQYGGQADTFARWIAAALEAHADRTPQDRAGRARPQERAAHRTGASRSFTVPKQTVDKMRRAIVTDNNNGHWPSDSAWCGDAIATAVDQARKQAGGVLPVPPPRLPNRLTR